MEDLGLLMIDEYRTNRVRRSSCQLRSCRRDADYPDYIRLREAYRGRGLIGLRRKIAAKAGGDHAQEVSP